MTPQEIMADLLHADLARRGYIVRHLPHQDSWRDDVIMLEVEGFYIALTHQNCTGDNSTLERVAQFLEPFPQK